MMKRTVLQRPKTKVNFSSKPHKSRPRSTQQDNDKTAAAKGSWQPVNQWYNELVGDKGHYYHQHVILPKSVELLDIRPNASLLDLACGQGVLARSIPEDTEYWGVDAARSLIDAARDRDKKPHHHFEVANLERPTLPFEKNNFTHATMILALQNVSKPEQIFAHAFRSLQKGGKFLLVINHPCFRIPRQSSWGVDEVKKTQYRRIDRYLSPLEIPIQAHPGQVQKTITWSYHFPLSTYITGLGKAGFAVTALEEWSSDKTSEGKAAKMENRSRSEIPLFMAILAEKK